MRDRGREKIESSEGERKEIGERGREKIEWGKESRGGEPKRGGKGG